MKTLATILLVLLTIVATAQRKAATTVYFKNGSVIKGRIIEDKPGEKIMIETADKSIWVFNSDEVDKIELSKQVKLKIPAEVDYTFKKGVFTQFQFEIMPSKKQNSLPGQNSLNAEGTVPALLGVIGYQVNNHFSVGLGTGAEAFHISMMPLFADLRYYFLNDSFTPFINLKAGYAIPLENQKDYTRNTNMKSSLGMMSGLEVGFLKSLSNTTKFTFSLGYRYQHLEQSGVMDQYNYIPVPVGSTNTYKVDRKIVSDFNRILISIGFRF